MNDSLAGTPAETKKIGAQEGNQNALKFDTVEKRQQLCREYCEHVRQGFSDDSFGPCDMKTFKHYREVYALDFPSDLIIAAQRDRMKFWETIGRNGTIGIPTKVNGKEYTRFNSDAWKFNMANRFKWKMREDVTSDDKPMEGPRVIIDTQPKDK